MAGTHTNPKMGPVPTGQTGKIHNSQALSSQGGIVSTVEDSEP